MWQSVFGLTNLIALGGWIILVLLPRKPLLLTVVLYLGVGLLCLVYAIGLIGLLSGALPPGAGDASGGNFSTIEGIRAIFASDAGVVIGWTHYLAFDLFTGLWIARDADAKDFSRWAQAPILLMTFMAGPLGLFVWLVVREKKARQMHGRPE
ncbi:MAG: DUF4281 domain-containing protein [Sphingomonadaceae bacterium]|nr:DUF4281 domain-containing protein [Sphingomonadaceae bacterium]